MNKYTPVIGLEIHVELRTRSKMFCGCPADHFGILPNTHTCPVCLGLPGALPVPNKQAIEWTIMIGQALNCTINRQSKFDRKHYFYPDLPKGYQISQYDEPLCSEGYLDTSLGRIGIERVHLEEDTGKLQHTKLNGERVSLVDFNRSGVPLVEIVTRPEIINAEHAREFAQKLQQLVRFLKVSDADMEKGSMRLEANISLREAGTEELPDYKVEVKNLNSFRFLKQAIEYELKRQEEVLIKGITPKQETRGYQESKGQTVSQRSKETSEDYRYFPEPDIPPLEYSQDEIEAIRSKMPVLPEALRDELIKKYKVREDYALILTGNPELAALTGDVMELCLKEGITPSEAAKLMVNRKIDPGTINASELVKVFKSELDKPQAGEEEMTQWVDEALEENPDLVEKYHSGKTSVAGALVGVVMRKTRGQADAQTVNRLLKEKLNSK